MSDPVAELDASGNIQAVNTFGAQGLVSRHTAATNASVFYTFDEGNVAQRLDSTGPVLSADLYDAFGARTGTAGASDPWGFGAQWGYQSDAETGLVLCTNRYYDPQQGRFLTRDPLGYEGGVNLYSYTQNNPVNYIDPTGFGTVTVRGKGRDLNGDYRSHIGDADTAKGWPHYDKVGSNGKIWIDSGGNIYVGNERQGTINDKDLPDFDDVVGNDAASNPGHVKAPAHYQQPPADIPMRDDGFWLPYIIPVPAVKGLSLLGDGIELLGKAAAAAAKACKTALPILAPH